MFFSVLGRCVTAVTLVTLFFQSFFISLFFVFPHPHPNKNTHNPFKMRAFGAVFYIFFLIFAVRKGKEFIKFFKRF